MNKDFNEWWNSDELIEDNPFGSETPAFWAWEGWQTGFDDIELAELVACEIRSMLHREFARHA